MQVLRLLSCIVDYRRRRGSSWLGMLLQQVSSMILDQAAMWTSVLSVKAVWITSGLLMKQILRERG
jgi:hypothetical protein